MISKLLPESAKTIHTDTGRWLRVLPFEGKGYALYDAVQEVPVGYILIDGQNFWIYDGNMLDIDEQEEIAGHILGHQKEMDQLIKTITF